MKTILLARHAKSSHSLGISSDFERPLNERGMQDAAEMGKRLFKKKIPIDLFVSSPALRAKTTAEIIADTYERKKKEILLVPSLYQAAPDQFADVIRTLDDQYDHVALFAHNPGITLFAASLTTTQIDHMPTGSVFAVTAPVDSWKDFQKATKSFSFFMRPE
jgi:phosphohistidine phosphatase